MERFAKRHRQTLNELQGSDSGQVALGLDAETAARPAGCDGSSNPAAQLDGGPAGHGDRPDHLRHRCKWRDPGPGPAAGGSRTLRCAGVVLLIKYISDQINKASNTPLVGSTSTWRIGRSASNFSTGCPSFQLVDPPAGVSEGSRQATITPTRKQATKAKHHLPAKPSMISRKRLNKHDA